jgi:hypothetical protein
MGETAGFGSSFFLRLGTGAASAVVLPFHFALPCRFAPTLYRDPKLWPTALGAAEFVYRSSLFAAGFHLFLSPVNPGAENNQPCKFSAP